ncbi:aspartyl-phosphate phosphatase Spo0E family protein [Crassaminicella thermophila]|uniref:Aspartyl-phosphate phosphatase Spo0E family protein n=1 Tax=Crassaminicella thermophila TaxID=2599308 RepID=A0A5C0SBK4_CRATE|nr:aspartyl-phosphate phosphatase Spo0E family protein [Crassaminicella thermophila]QEK11943.1 aspartyl-phosphate phosphatase Spo0E family protein [Crassaminicella thermophila]
MPKGNIEKLQYKLNHLIELEYNYEEIYNISVELDKLIVAFYKNKMIK